MMTSCDLLMMTMDFDDDGGNERCPCITQAMEKSRNGVKAFPIYENLMKPRGENQVRAAEQGI